MVIEPPCRLKSPFHTFESRPASPTYAEFRSHHLTPPPPTCALALRYSFYIFHVPGGAEGLLARRKAKEALASESPWEATRRKERERKKARKKAIKERMEAEEEARRAGLEDEDEEDEREDGGGRVSGVAVPAWWLGAVRRG